MDPNMINYEGFDTTAIIFAVVILIVAALRYFHNKYPSVSERFQDATPWMGWSESIPTDEIEYTTVAPRHMRAVSHR